MIVFGAGASYDSVRSRRDLGNFSIYSYPFRPPLADQLFDNRGYFNEALNLYPEARSIAQRLRDLPAGASLEDRLSGFLKESETYEPLRRQLTAVRFYLWECGRKWGEEASWTTNYLGLLHQIDRFWRHARQQNVCLVSFNYDFMLDKALEAVIERPLASFEDYIRPPYWLIKPHGSVNWRAESGALSNMGSKASTTRLSLGSMTWQLLRGSRCFKGQQPDPHTSHFCQRWRFLFG